MTDEAAVPGEHLDLSSDPQQSAPASPAKRRFVGVRYACCDVYARVYVNAAGTAYQGNCPRCAQRIELKIGPGGTDSRFFEAR